MNQYPILRSRENTAKWALLISAIVLAAITGWVYVSYTGKSPTLEGYNGTAQTWDGNYHMANCEDFLYEMDATEATTAAADFLKYFWMREHGIVKQVPSATAIGFRDRIATTCDKMAEESGYPDWYGGSSLPGAAVRTHYEGPVKP